MTRWLLAAIIGSMIAALHYGPRLRAAASRRPLIAPALLRAMAAALLTALLLRAPLRAGVPLAPLVAIDVSASWMRGGASGSRWAEASAMAMRAASGDSILLVGDSLRFATAIPGVPTDVSSSASAAAKRALAEGRSLLLITDGEGGALPASSLSPGSRVEMLRRAPAPDLAMGSLELAARAAPGDTVTVSLTARAGEAGSAAATVVFTFGGARSVELPLPALDAWGERPVSFRIAVPQVSGQQIVRAIARMPNDPEPANDTVAALIEVTRAPVAVLVSTAPDPDARDALEALRGALAAAPMGFYRVAKGQWRSAGALQPVSEADVRRALSAAPLAVIHGDTSLLGAPMSLTRGSLILMIPGAADARVEWRATPTAESPIVAALAGIAWDSVPPLEPSSAPAKGEWTALVAAPSGGGDRRSIVAGADVGGRRRAVVASSGMWQWRARAGVAGDAYGALWGALIDWVGRTRPDARAALPEAAAIREGDRVAWRRGGSDTLVTAIVVRRDPPPSADTVHLDFRGGATTTQTPSLRVGEYVVTVPGGSALLVVNRSREFLPTRPTLRAISIPGQGPRAPAAPLRDSWWPFALALVALCGEWVLRRRVGLR